MKIAVVLVVAMLALGVLADKHHNKKAAHHEAAKRAASHHVRHGGAYKRAMVSKRAPGGADQSCELQCTDPKENVQIDVYVNGNVNIGVAVGGSFTYFLSGNVAYVWSVEAGVQFVINLETGVVLTYNGSFWAVFTLEASVLSQITADFNAWVMVASNIQSAIIANINVNASFNFSVAYAVLVRANAKSEADCVAALVAARFDAALARSFAAGFWVTVSAAINAKLEFSGGLGVVVVIVTEARDSRLRALAGEIYAQMDLRVVSVDVQRKVVVAVNAALAAGSEVQLRAVLKAVLFVQLRDDWVADLESAGKLNVAVRYVQTSSGGLNVIVYCDGDGASFGFRAADGSGFATMYWARKAQGTVFIDRYGKWAMAISGKAELAALIRLDGGQAIIYNGQGEAAYLTEASFATTTETKCVVYAETVFTYLQTKGKQASFAWNVNAVFAAVVTAGANWKSAAGVSADGAAAVETVIGERFAVLLRLQADGQLSGGAEKNGVHLALYVAFGAVNEYSRFFVGVMNTLRFALNARNMVVCVANVLMTVVTGAIGNMVQTLQAVVGGGIVAFVRLAVNALAFLRASAGAAIAAAGSVQISFSFSFAFLLQWNLISVV